MKSILFLLSVLFTQTVVIAQFKISGKVVDARDGSPISNAKISLLQTNITTKSAIDGSYEISAPKVGSYNLSVVYKNVEKVIENISIGETITYQNISFELPDKLNSEVVVTTKVSAKKESTAALIAVQKNTSVTAQVLSAEMMRRTPDKHVGEALKRVTGTSVQENKYLIVRGLSDRYNIAMLNGIQLGSTEPDRKTFSFDIIPSAMIDNIVMNKAFLPELPAEWAGGLVQVQTKDIPSKNFSNIQIGTGFNTLTIGNRFLTTNSNDFLEKLGIAGKSRNLPSNFPTKFVFNSLSTAEQTDYAKSFANNWAPNSGNAPLNLSLQYNTGKSFKLFGKKAGFVLSTAYNSSNRRMPFDNKIIANDNGDLDLVYNNNRFSKDILLGGLANFSFQFNNKNRISFKNIINVNSSDFVIDRYDGRDYILSGGGAGDRVKATEIGYRQNTFFTTQLMGEHSIERFNAKLKYYGSFNILDQYIPDQRRLFYTQDASVPNAPFLALLGLGAGQKSGSIFFSNLNDYIYTTGGDLSKEFSIKNLKQTVKGGYMLQIKDRLFNARPFFLNTSDNSLKSLSASQIFSPQNFGVGSNKVQMGELFGNAYRYLANTILNAGYLQFDNNITNKLRLAWGVRAEHFDQLVGSVRRSDERHVYSKVLDFLPGANFTYSPDKKTNIRASISQTVIRPEFRELSPFAFYDFELNAQIVGNPKARRTKVTNFDLRYEIYPEAGELFTVGVFYKKFLDPIEYYFNRTGPATNTFNIANTKQATNYGFEIEGRKKLYENFTVFGNASIIRSRVTDTVALNRPLQGQSPYLANLGLQYDLPKKGLNTTIVFNQVGRRIFFVGDASDQGIPAIWEAPRPLLDLQIAKSILNKRGELKLNISDILNRPANFYHDLDDSGRFKQGTKDVLSIRRIMGTTFGLSFNYNLNK